MKKLVSKLIIILILSIVVFVFVYRSGLLLDILGLHIEIPFVRSVEVADEYSMVDYNNNGIPDPLDIVYAARKEVEQRTNYESNYYPGGYPPDDEGVCTDVIWRGFFGAGIDLKSLIDEDIATYTEEYPRVQGTPEPNIDFRRVPNQSVFFERHAESLTTELISYDIENLKEWQPGDIVVFLDDYHHVGIISDKRAKDGTPYMIHNSPPFASEVKLKSMNTPIAGHYRWHFED
ncbi:MAG: DUF1287 domain-containing protein [Bacillaceae bacterium]|nr:DUF1287 domain-containing protein [Bacillaceae bacterium]